MGRHRQFAVTRGFAGGNSVKKLSPAGQGAGQELGRVYIPGCWTQTQPELLWRDRNSHPWSFLPCAMDTVGKLMGRVAVITIQTTVLITDKHKDISEILQWVVVVVFFFNFFRITVQNAKLNNGV